MVSFNALESKQASILVVGMGYVGLPLAVLLSKHFSVIGLDIDATKIAELQQGIDRTHEVSSAALSLASIEYTTDPSAISRARFIIVAVPTPVHTDTKPDLSIVEKATQSVGKYLQKDSVVVYESTVYPGVTEEICVPILEKESGLTFGTDFTVGYSPERVNPGDKQYTIDKITKVVAGSDEGTSTVLQQVYGKSTNIFCATSIRVAEAAKVIENTQRDLNIALMNELAIIFQKMNISVYDVLAAAETKWNFLPFRPGLVVGHCIGVDPYYLTFKATALGYTPQVILAGRGVNDGMPAFLANQIDMLVQQSGKTLADVSCLGLGITFKENVPDVRNSKVASLYHELQNRGAVVSIIDPLANTQEVLHEYDIVLTTKERLAKADILIAAVAHTEYAAMTPNDIAMLLNPGGWVIDIKHIYSKEAIEALGFHYWSL